MPKEFNEFLKKDDFGELQDALGYIWEIAADFKLDPFPTHFEIVPPQIMHEIGSYGLPGRFSHWTHGRSYRQLKTHYDYGLSKIYEVVINSNPSQAFLLENNIPTENKLVMAHVLGHTDFFKNNHLFLPTRKDMVQSTSLSAARIRDHESRVGRLDVEQFLDATLSIAEHIDPYNQHRLSRDEQLKAWREEFKNQRQKDTNPRARTDYDDLFQLDDKDSKLDLPVNPNMPIPLHPDRDILGFLHDFAPYLEDWQRDVIDIVRGESLYFRPQIRTKIMNEGWASFWHKRIMQEMGERGLITDAEFEIWSRMHAGVVSPNPKQLNPYHFGMYMFEYISAYNNGDLSDQEKQWLKKEGLPIPPRFDGDYKQSPGLVQVREVMKGNDDQSFIRNYFDRLAAGRLNMYLHQRIEEDGQIKTIIVDRGWEKIREALVSSMTNCGSPLIMVADGDYNRRQELYLRHQYEGQELDLSYLTKTLPYIYKMWGRPVYLETVIKDKQAIFNFNGEKI